MAKVSQYYYPKQEDKTKQLTRIKRHKQQNEHSFFRFSNAIRNREKDSRKCISRKKYGIYIMG